MKFILKRKNLIKSLIKVSGFVNNNIKLPILNNILIQVNKNYLKFVGTNLKTEIIFMFLLKNNYSLGITTVSAKKFLYIWKSFSEEADILVKIDNNRLLIQSGNSKYFLSTLPYFHFPSFNNFKPEIQFNIKQSNLKRLIELTQFSMAKNDIRYYLNGTLLLIENNKIKTVTTDGSRLSVCSLALNKPISPYSVIIPRKSILELTRMLEFNNNLVKVKISNIRIRINIDNYIFTSKLIEGSFPNYKYIVPKHINIRLKLNCQLFKQTLSRLIILSNKQFNNVKLFITFNKLKISTSNFEHEEAEEIIDILYEGNDLEINLNANYVIDVLNVLKCDKIEVLFIDEFSIIQILDCDNIKNIYIIMPIYM